MRSARFEGVGGGCVIHVDNNAEAGGDIRAEGPQGEDEVEGLELMDERVGMGEVGVVFLGVALLLGEGTPTCQAGVALENPIASHGQGVEMDAILPLSIGT